MRPLKADGAGRAAPNPQAQPQPRRRRVPRRKPAPRWRRPALIAGTVLLSLGLLAGSGVWFWRSGAPEAISAAGWRVMAGAMRGVGLTVQEINVHGRNVTPPEELLRAVGVSRGDPILLFDAEAARQRVERIGWVRSATVQRRLPDTILLHIVERRPFARWQIDGKTVLVDRDGKVLSQGRAEDFRQLRRVVGPGAADQVGALFDMLMLEPALFERVRTAVRVRQRRWDLVLDNGTVVRLPEENMEGAWRHLAMVEREQKLLAKALSSIDLRLPDRLVVQVVQDAVPLPPERKPVAKDGGTGRRA